MIIGLQYSILISLQPAPINVLQEGFDIVSAFQSVVGKKGMLEKYPG